MKTFYQSIRSCDPKALALSFLVVGSTIGGVFAGCKVTDLRLRIKEVDVLHEQSLDAVTNAASSPVRK